MNCCPTRHERKKHPAKMPSPSRIVSITLFFIPDRTSDEREESLGSRAVARLEYFKPAMRYWWVNHKQTFRHEFEGGYIWCPKRKRDGSRNRFYDFLREVTPGDIVLSYASGVRGVGFAISHRYTCPRPAEFGHIGEAWDVVGQRVDVAFRRVPRVVHPKEHLDVLRPLIVAERFSPLRETGDGLQHVYLTSISQRLAEVVLGLAGADVQQFAAHQLDDADRPLVERELVGQQEWEDIEQRRIVDGDIANTTRKALISARVGQGLFKERVSRIERACRITFVDNPTHLIASHIKPWRESTNEERLHEGNGLLLTPTVDHLFDRGFISFQDSGELMLSPVADIASLGRMGVDRSNPPRPVSFNTDQKHFLNYHRTEIFLAAAE
jgi:putative restriction endonuclease